MTYQKFNHKNNAICLLDLAIADDATVLIAKGAYNRFPTSNFIIQVTEVDADGNVTARENMLIATRSGSTFNIDTRAYEAVPIDDDATSSIQQALPFSGNAVIENVMSTAVIEDIQNETTRLENDKLDVADFQNGTKIYEASSTGTDAYSITPDPAITSYMNGQVFKFLADVANTGAATLNVNSLWAITIKKLHDQDLATWDIEAGQIVTVSYAGGAFQMDSQVATLPTVDIGGQIEKTNFDLDDELLINDIDGWANKKQKLKTVFWQSFVAWENISIDDAIYISTSDGKAYRTDATSTTKIQIVGFALNTVTTWQTVYVWFSPKIESGNIVTSSANANSTTYNSVDSGTNSMGYKITTTKACYITSVTKSASCTATRVQIKDSGGTVIDSANFSWNTATFSSPVALSNATVYRIECNSSWASYSWHTKSGSTFNSSTDFNYTAWSNNGWDSNWPSGQTMSTYGFSITTIQTILYTTTKVAGTVYFLSDLPWKINATAWTYKCKVGIALTSAILAFQPQVKDTYIT